MKTLSTLIEIWTNMANSIVDQIPELVSAATQYLSDLQNLNTALALFCILNVFCIALTTKDLFRQTNKLVKIAPFFILSILHAFCFCGYFYNQASIVAMIPYVNCLSVSVLATMFTIRLAIGIRKAITITCKILKWTCVGIVKLIKLGVENIKEFFTEHKPAFEKASNNTIKFFKMVGLLVLMLARRAKEKVLQYVPVVKRMICKGIIAIINLTKKATRAVITFFQNIRDKYKRHMDDDDYDFMTMT